MVSDPNMGIIPITVPKRKGQIPALADKVAQGLSRLYYPGQIVRYVGPSDDSHQLDEGMLHTREVKDEGLYLLRGSLTDVKDLKERVRAFFNDLFNATEFRKIDPTKALGDIQVNPLELRINGHYDEYSDLIWDEFWTMTTLECYPNPASNYRPVGLEYGLRYIQRQIDEFTQRVEAVRNNPEATIDILKEHKNDIIEPNPFEFSEDERVRDMQLRGMGCIWARKAFRYQEIYTLLKFALTPADRFKVQQAYVAPETGFYAVMPQTDCWGEQKYPPYIFNVQNFGAKEKSEPEIAEEIVGIYPTLFYNTSHELYPTYLAFAVPEFALDLVNECIEIKRRPATPSKMIFTKVQDTINQKHRKLLAGD